MGEVSTLTSFWASPIPLLTSWKVLEEGCAAISGHSSRLFIHS